MKKFLLLLMFCSGCPTDCDGHATERVCLACKAACAPQGMNKCAAGSWGGTNCECVGSTSK